MNEQGNICKGEVLATKIFAALKIKPIKPIKKSSFSSYWSTPQIKYQRSLDTSIYKTDVQFWAVSGSYGCRENKKQICHKYATFVFLAKKVDYFFLHIVVSKLKSCILCGQSMADCLETSGNGLWSFLAGLP